MHTLREITLIHQRTSNSNNLALPDQEFIDPVVELHQLRRPSGKAQCRNSVIEEGLLSPEDGFQPQHRVIREWGDAESQSNFAPCPGREIKEAFENGHEHVDIREPGACQLLTQVRVERRDSQPQS